MKRLLFFIFYCFHTFGWSQTHIQISNQSPLVEVGKNLSYLEDQHSTLTLDQVKKSNFIPSNVNSLNFNVTSSTIWGKIRVQNFTDDKSVIEFEYSNYEVLEIFIFDEKDSLLKKEADGLAYDIRKRKIFSSTIVFELPKTDAPLTIYFRATSMEPLLLPVRVGTLTEWHKSNDKYQWVIGFFYGLVFIMLLYNFLIYLYSRDLSYLLYVGFGFFFSLSVIHVQGFLHFFSPTFHEFFKIYNASLGVFAMIFGFRFVVVFLKTETYLPWATKIINFIIYTSLSILLVDLLGFRRISYNMVNFFGTVPLFFYITISFIIYKKGYFPAIFYFIAFLSFEFFLTLHILTIYNVIPDFLGIHSYYLNIASSCEITLLSFALAYKINILRHDNESIHLENLRLSQAQNTVLEDNVKERTAELNETIEELNQSNKNLQSTLNLLQRKKLELEELNEEKDGIIGVVAHDLRAPFSRQEGLIEILRYEKITDDQLNLLNLMEDTCRQGTTLINDLLFVSNNDKNKEQVELSMIDMISLMESVVKSFEIQAQKKMIIILMHYPNTFVLLESNSNFIRRILENLLSNAIKFSDSNRKIYVRLDKTENEVLISVKDEGQGISQEDLPKLFKKFQRIATKPTAGEESTGLGLSIVKSLIERLNGSIEVESKQNVGTTMIIHFPLHPSGRKQSQTANYQN